MLVAGFFVTMGLAFVFGGLALGVGEASHPGPGMFAFVVGGVVALLATIEFVRERRQSEIRIRCPDLRAHAGALMVLSGLVAFLLVAQTVGFLPSLFALVLFLVYRVGLQSIWTSLIYSGSTIAVVFALFENLLGMQFPRGLLDQVVP